MSEGKRRDDWDRASLICAQVTNAQATRKQDLIPYWKFHPFELRDRAGQAPPPDMSLSDPKDLARLMGVKVD